MLEIGPKILRFYLGYIFILFKAIFIFLLMWSAYGLLNE